MNIWYCDIYLSVLLSCNLFVSEAPLIQGWGRNLQLAFYSCQQHCSPGMKVVVSYPDLHPSQLQCSSEQVLFQMCFYPSLIRDPGECPSDNVEIDVTVCLELFPAWSFTKALALATIWRYNDTVFSMMWDEQHHLRRRKLFKYRNIFIIFWVLSKKERKKVGKGGRPELQISWRTFLANVFFGHDRKNKSLVSDQ